MPNIEIVVPAGAGPGAVADLRGLKGLRSYVFSGPQQANVQVELSPNGVDFFSIKSLLFAAPNAVHFDCAMDFARATRANNGVSGTCKLFVAADAIDCCCGGGGCDPQCQFPVSGTTSSTSGETVTIGSFAPPSDGTYTIQWAVTGRVLATGEIISTTAISQFTVIGGSVVEVNETHTTDVDQPTGFGTPSSSAGVGIINFTVVGKANTPAHWTLGGCAQADLGVVPPP